MNRKEERLLTLLRQKRYGGQAALSSTEEEREKRARGRFWGSMREWFRGSLSPALSSIEWRRGRNSKKSTGLMQPRN